MEEFNTRIECPHCGEKSFETVAFNFLEADQSGCHSRPQQIECSDCYKKYWIKAHVSFDVDVHTISKRKIKDGYR